MQSENRNIDELKSGFETFYQSRILPIMQDMEKVRQKYLRYFILACCLAIVAIPLLMCGIFYFQLGASIAEQNSSSFADSAIYGLVVLIITICATPIALYKKKAKSKIMPIMLQYFEGFNYQYKKTISSVNINDTRLIGFYDGREGDDYFDGVYKNVPIKVSEEKFTQRKLVYRNNKPHYENVEVFHGVLILLDMNKNLSGQTVVLQDKGFLNVFSKVSRDLKGLSNVKLEDSVFEKEFEVFASDQVEARYLLTTAFMERMLKLRAAYHADKIEFSFLNNQLFIALETNRDMFEATSLFKTCLNKKLVEDAYLQIVSIFAIIDILSLDKRIGL